MTRTSPKILFISSDDKFPPFRVDVKTLFGKELASRGYEIHWLLQSEQDCAKAYWTEWLGGRAWVGPTDNGTSFISRLNKHLLGNRHYVRMFALVRRNRYDTVIVKDSFVAALPAIIASRIGRAKFVFWLSYPFPEAWIFRAREGTARYPLLYLVRGFLAKALLYHVVLPAAYHIFVQSEQMRSDLIGQGGSKKKLTAVPMGVALEDIPYDFSDKPSSEDKTRPMVLYLGTLSRVRRLDFVIRAFAKVLRNVPSAVLYFVGGGYDPADEGFLKKKALGLGIADSVVWTGQLSFKKAWEYVQAADICLSPFYPSFVLNSTSPTKLIEYMAMGKPVVANDHPEQKVVIAESGGGICVPWDENAFASAIVELLNNPIEAAQMGKRGRAYVEKYRSYKVIADMVDRKYREIIYRTIQEGTHRSEHEVD